MYSANLNVVLPGSCYFCNRSFIDLKDIAIVEGHIFCPTCGYEIIESKLAIIAQVATTEDYNDVRCKRIGASTSR
jgi:hypothetical protein